MTNKLQLHVPLENKNPGTEGFHMIPDSSEDSLLPISNLTATSVLGGRVPGQETIGQLYARQIASAIVTKSPDENRLLVVGLGLDTAEADRDVFFGIIELVLRCVYGIFFHYARDGRDGGVYQFRLAILRDLG